MADDKLAAELAARGERKAKQKLDKRMPLGVKLNADGTGSITGDVTAENAPDLDDAEAWAFILDDYPGISPVTHEVDERYPIEISAHEGMFSKFVDPDAEAKQKTAEKVRMFRYKAKIRRRRKGERLPETKIKELCALVRKRKPLKATTTTGGDGWFVAALADFQLGCGDYGGTPKIVERVLASLEQIEAKLKASNPDGILLVDMGDIVEQVACFYPGQEHTIDLNLTEQIDLAIELVLKFIDVAIKYAPRVIFGAVPSNHGTMRVSKGTVSTDEWRDNIDLIIANAVRRIMDANPERYGHVEVWTPPLLDGDAGVLTLALPVDGGDPVMMGMAHGHQVKTMGKQRMPAIEQWWKNHQWTDGKRHDDHLLPTAADADILLFGHGHTLILSEQTGRLAIQCPSSDNGSEYFTMGTGGRASAGMLTFWVDRSRPTFAGAFDIV